LSLRGFLIDAGQSEVYPSCQPWADEIESVLQCLKRHGQFEKYLPRLHSTGRDPAFAEARIAHFLEQGGFSITDWEPESPTGCPGDLEIQYAETEALFVEVKQPGWGSELSDVEKEAGRWHEPKYRNAEVRSVDPADNVNYSIEKALKKFVREKVNIVAVEDDLMVSPFESSKALVVARIRENLARPENSAVSAVLLLRPFLTSEEVQYDFGYIVGEGRPLPESVLERIRGLETW